MGKAVFWEIDRRLEEVARNPQWAAFHRATGNAEVYFAVERHGTSAFPKKYTVTAIRYGRLRENVTTSEDIAEVSGPCPLQATIEAFHAARAAGAASLDREMVRPLEQLVAPEPAIDETLAEFGL